MKKLLGLMLVATGLVAVGARGDEAAETALIKKKAQSLGDSIKKGDYATLADLTYPKVVQMAGGKEKMVERVSQQMEQMKAQGVTLTRVDVGEPGKRASKGKHTFVVVPSTTELATPDAKIAVKSYLLGISPDGGKTWTFIDGNGLANKQGRDLILPEMPEGFQLPEPQKPEITRKAQ